MVYSKTILITGASGFLATWLAESVTKSGYNIIGIDLRTPANPGIWKKFSTSSLETVDFGELLKNEKLTAVCHLAGGASVAHSVIDPFADFSSLLPGTARLALFLAKEQPATHLLLFSSAAVYGNPKKNPIAETDPIIPISPYGIHKALAESLLAQYGRVFGLPITILRIFSVYGAGLKKQLIWDVSQRVINARKQHKKSITLFGTGRESRDFIYVEDLCRAALTIIAKKTKEPCQEIYNIGSGMESSISEVAKCIVQFLEPCIEVCFDGELPKGDPANWKADITRLRQVGYEPEFALTQGLKNTISWIKGLPSSS